jgi:hypothetical protein
MTRFICWLLVIGFSIGFWPSLGALTLKIAKAAVRAHRYDQMSYSKFTRTLLNAKPRSVKSTSEN